MTRRIPAVVLALGLTSALAQAQSQPLDWPDKANGTPASESRPAEPVATEATAVPQPAATAFPLEAGPGPGDPGLPPGRFWVGADFLLWFLSSERLPPLLATAPAGRSGNLNDPLTRVAGHSSYGGGVRPGGLFYLGGWIDQHRTFGIQASAFVLGGDSTSFSAASNGVNGLVTRPFFNDLTGLQDAYVVAGPNSSGGGLVSATSDQLVGVNVLLREHLCCLSCPWMRVDALGGYRFLHLADRLRIDDNFVITGAGNSLGLPVGTQVVGQDNFASSTSFHGVDVGLTGETFLDRFVVNWVGKIALGTNHQTLNINGNTTINQPGAVPAVYPAGFLATQTNAGSYGRQELSFSPEFDLKLSYRLTPQLLVSIGYTLIYWSAVFRAPSQLDSVVNPNFVPPPTGNLTGDVRPAFSSFSSNGVWLQGLNLGLQYRF
jgi:hypothetical protein